MPTATLDTGAKNLAIAIRSVETGGNPNARGGSGEWGAYQFKQPTWDDLNKKFGTDYQFGSASLEQQNELAYKQIKAWKDQGYNAGQIASLWNSGSPDWQGKVGVNAYGVKYDTPKYVNSVYGAYQRIKAGQNVGADANNPSNPATQPAEPLNTANQIPGKGVFGLGGIESGIEKGIANIGNFLGIEPIGRYVGAKIAQGVDKLQGIDLEQLHQQGKISDAEYQTLTTGGVSGRQALASAGNLALDIGTVGLGSGLGAGARIGLSAAEGAGFGAMNALANSNNMSQTLKDIAGGAFLGGAAGAAGEALAKGVSKVSNFAFTKALPKLLTYTSEVPEGAIQDLANNESLQKAVVSETLGKSSGSLIDENGNAVKLFSKEGTPQLAKQLGNALYDSETGVFADLSKQYGQGVDALQRQFENTPMPVSNKFLSDLQAVSDKYSSTQKPINVPSSLQGIFAPAKAAYEDMISRGAKVSEDSFMANAGVKGQLSLGEALQLNKELNAFTGTSSPYYTELRQLKNQLTKYINDTYGGENGAVRTFLTNWGNEAGIAKKFSAIQRAVQKGSSGKKIAQLMSDLTQMAKDNKGAYARVLKKLESSSGSNFMEALATMNFKNWIGGKNSRFALMRYALLPLMIIQEGLNIHDIAIEGAMSPRTVGLSTIMASRVAKIAQKVVPPEGQNVARLIALNLLFGTGSNPR